MQGGRYRLKSSNRKKFLNLLSRWIIYQYRIARPVINKARACCNRRSMPLGYRICKMHKCSGSAMNGYSTQLCFNFDDCDFFNHIALTNLINDFDIFSHLAEHGVATIEVLRILTTMADEKLRSTGVFSSVSH